MDIKVGFVDTARELTISTDLAQDEVSEKVSAALSDDAGIFDLKDKKGRRYLIRSSRIAYVEVGVPAHHSVGFSGS